MLKRICSNTAVAVLLCHSVGASAASATSDNAFNPAVSFIMVGTYGNLQRDPTVPVTGFAMNPVPGHQQGFNLGESELGLAADIDPQFRGVATISLLPSGGSSVENAFVQTTALENGVNLKFGRFFSALGYLNEQHSHTWDFVDQPLVYSVLWGDQLKDDGIQLKWLAPTDLFVEVGGEVGKGSNFPGTNTAKNGSGAGTLFVHIGDDIGIEQSWRAGLSLHQTRQTSALSTGVPDQLNTPGGVSDSFTGSSNTAGLDFVWKYSHNGNFRESYLKVQSEYFRRKDSGQLTYDTAGANLTGSYTGTQSGWYLQSVYQFTPNWRSGIRYDRLDPGTVSLGAALAGKVIANYGYNPSRFTWMADYNTSEFARIRLQLAHDNSRQGLADNQLFVQYIMAMGAHGAHQY
ncbi:TonB-dependent receptor [Sideroxydans lithotrophicus]|uniref:Phosphate-selective porin O and P n=1 Tax=Sideroxydans lithotrophicus (strain ES-1) TaxID=580332 RepID=D5CMQ7_SIDLE|nr:TonB-dependent receptor [Sideroxydans lithotrophicus]ADE10743.1 conserved hypothetical protein [Sideroxydans lithotrophicus ES-1]